MRQSSFTHPVRHYDRSRRRHAFSLVEVTLALGIAATALLVVFSLIPLGLSSLQDSGRQIVETEIYNKIGSELAATSIYDNSSSSSRANVINQQYCNDPNRFPAYFDAEGNELTKTAGGTPPPQAVFTVRCICDTPSKNDPVANSWGKTATTGEMIAVSVNIGFHQDPGPSPTPSTNPNIRKREFLISNHGS